MNPFDIIKRNAQGIVDKGKGFVAPKFDINNIPNAPMSKPFDIRNIPNAPMSKPPSGIKKGAIATRDFFLSPRGFSREEIRTAKPTISEGFKAPLRMTAEIAQLPGFIGTTLLEGLYKRPAPALGQKRLQEFAQPKTAGEAKLMQLADAALFAPMGTLKGIKIASNTISKARDVNIISKELKAIGLADDVIRETAPKLVRETNPERISRIITNSSRPQTQPLINVAKEVANTNDVPSIIKTITNKTNITPAQAKVIGQQLKNVTDKKEALSIIRGVNGADNLRLRREFIKDTIDSSPFSQKGVVEKLKHLVNREGQFLEQADIAKGSRTSKIFHEIKENTGYNDRYDSDFIKDVEAYWRGKQSIKQLTKEIGETPKVQSTVVKNTPENKSLQAVSEQTTVKDPQVPFKKGPIKPEGEVTVRMYATGKKVQTPLAPDARIRAFVNQSAFDNFVKTVDSRALGHPNLTTGVMNRNNIDIAKIGDEYVSFNPKALQAKTNLPVNHTPPPGVQMEEFRNVDNFNPKDIKGEGMSHNIQSLVEATGNQTLADVKKNGYNPFVVGFFNFKRAEAASITFVNTMNDKLGKALKGISKQEMQQIADYRLGDKSIVLNSKLGKANKEITSVTDEIRDIYNAWASKNNQPQMGYIDDYLTKKMKYDDTFIDDKVLGFKDSFSLERVGGKLPGEQEKDLGVLLGGYLSSVKNKMFMEGAYDSMKSMSKLMKEKGAVNSARWVDEWIKEMTTFKAKGNWTKGFEAIISARSTAALAFNPLWSATIQPLSSTMTVARTLGRDTPVSFFKGLKPSAEDVKFFSDLPTYQTKTSQTLSRTGLGDIGERSIRPRLNTTRALIEQTLGATGDFVERKLSEQSAIMARAKAKRMGFSPEDTKIYSDFMIGKTQSEYIKSARPKALRAPLVRLLAPFQTYAFEAGRFVGTGLGLNTSQKLTYAERATQLTAFFGMTYAINELYKDKLNRNIMTPGTYVGVLGPSIDYAIAKMQGKTDFEIGRSPMGMVDDIAAIGEGIHTYFKTGNWQPIVKEITKWGTGFAGIPGGVQWGRVIDGVMFNARGYHISKAGNPTFKAETITDKVLAPITGPYITPSGNKYIQGGFQQPIKTRSELAGEVEKKLQSGEFGSTAVAKEYFSEELKSIAKSESNRRLKLSPSEYSTELEKAIEKKHITVEEAKKEFQKYRKQEGSTDRTKEYVENRSTVGLVLDYGKAFVIDPGNAWKALGPNEKLGIVEGNLVEMQRFKLVDHDKEGGSDEYKQKAMAQLGIPWSESKNYKLEHIVPVKAGGDTSANNLKIVTNSEWNEFTKWDKIAVKAVMEGRMTRKEVSEIAIKLKMDKTITVQQALSMLK